MLFVIAILGVAGIVALSWVLGDWQDARLDDPHAVSTELKKFYPDFEIADQILSADGRAAIARDQSHTLALIFALGDQFVARILDANTLRGVRVDNPDTPHSIVHVSLADPSCPHVDLSIDADTPAVDSWVRDLQAAQQGERS